MSFLVNSLTRALELILTLDPEFVGIVALSLKISGIAIIIASGAGLMITILLEWKDFPGKRVMVTIMNTFMGLPPVVVGLFLYMVLSRSGPLGFLHILYTPAAMVTAQVILAIPIIAGLSYASLVSADPSIRFAALSLGASQFQATVKVLKDIRYGILAAIMAGLGRVMAEVGAVLVVGGNIAGYTRVMTTAIALEADKGDFELAIALGIILLLLSFLINGTLYFLRGRHMGQ
jgi:tungstate transport system permease protein